MRNWHPVDFALLTVSIVRIKESRIVDKYLDLARELKEAEEPEGDDDTNCSWCHANGLHRHRKMTWNQKEWDHPDIKIN